LTPIILLAAILLMTSVKILREYDRAVVFTFGRFQAVRGPGIVLLIPLVQQMVRVSLRVQVIEIPTQDVISKDNVSMKVDAVLYFQVVDPERAIIKVADFLPATIMLAQTTLRAVLGQHSLDDMLSERLKLNADLQAILDDQTEHWGLKVSNVEIRTLDLTENMVRAIAKQAEAERDRRAKIIPRRRGVPGLADPGQRRPDPFDQPERHAVALPADPHRDRGGAELHRHLPHAVGHRHAAPEDPADDIQGVGRGTWRRQGRRPPGASDPVNVGRGHRRRRDAEPVRVVGGALPSAP
jgi:hypothetical protein